MIRRPTILLATLAIAAVSLPLLAAPRLGLGRGDDEQPLLERVTHLLALDAEQQEKAEQIFGAARTRAEPLRDELASLRDDLQAAIAVRDRDAIADTVLAMDSLRTELETIRDRARADLVTHLNDEQRERLELAESWIGERAERRGRFGRRND